MNIKMNIMNNSYLHIDLSALRGNVESIIASLPEGCNLIPVLKDNAYGLGLCPIAAELAGFERISCVAVAHVSEGLSLRAGGFEKDILVMGSPLPFQLDSAILTKLTLCLSSAESAALINEAAGRLGMKVRVQLKLDIGLHRIGFDTGDELDAFIKDYRRYENLVFSGSFSHFSYAGNDELCQTQYELFDLGIKKLEKSGINCHPCHISCSASSELYPQYTLDAVRLGRRLYMDNPDKPLGGIREPASWRSYVTSVKERRAGEHIGYSSGYVLPEDSVVATVGVGYGDGLDLRMCDKHMNVLINGKLCPLLVCCMDQCMVDVSGLECRPGDEVTIFGYDGMGGYISAQELAMDIGANEGCALTSALSTRVARIYSK